MTKEKFMNKGTLFKSVNLEIIKRLNKHYPVYIEDFDDDNSIVSFDGVSVVIPKSQVLTNSENMLKGSGGIKKIFNETGWKNASLPLADIELIGRDYFISDNQLYYVWSFGTLKGITFGNAMSATVNNSTFILLKDNDNEPRVILFSTLYALEKVREAPQQTETPYFILGV